MFFLVLDLSHFFLNSKVIFKKSLFTYNNLPIAAVLSS